MKRPSRSEAVALLAGTVVAVTVTLLWLDRTPFGMDPASSPTGPAKSDVGSPPSAGIVPPDSIEDPGRDALPHVEPKSVADSSSSLTSDQRTDWLYHGPESRERLPASYFDEQYPGDLTLDELRQKTQEVVSHMMQLGEQLFQQRYEAGLFETRVPPPVVDGEPAYDIAVSKSDGPALQVRTSFDDPHHVHVVWLPFDEHADYYALKDEWTYLASRVAKMDPGSSGEWPIDTGKN